VIDPHDMMCQELVEVLTEYLDGTLGAPDRARLDAHLGVCDDCEVYLEQLETTISLAGRVHSSELSADTRAGLLRAFRDLRH
jgi:anti-sigma factor RsiW